MHEQSKETEIVEHLCATIQNFISCSSYTIDNDITLDYDDKLDDSSKTVSENSEIDEEVDPTFSEDRDDKSILNHSSLDYMEQVVACHDEADGQGIQNIPRDLSIIASTKFQVQLILLVFVDRLIRMVANTKKRTVLIVLFVLFLKLPELNQLLFMMVIYKDGLGKQLKNSLSHRFFNFFLLDPLLQEMAQHCFPENYRTYYQTCSRE